ncbi:hypothetical protein RRV45_06945 [Bacillus sp. DTU_2020_1000418_1_SI_GHA_SEK_038]|uniref:hypothetical protein n=1 Tax=Bacillus sp. DTU_2020_1000418_1_SI_GHA_SEK_038 TaxID=3077585 RepID=UPI0028E5E2BB|nr:hypothetical protein [Bacillus sp. DTU_2020_1000418_1_SI_GHA_SEK_038]WNS76718.1 hypothetical protein RRV45_06945 [Bacillus sp. DTU_2020_1000418_1_SI_GHA_SEK_038]
MKKYAILIGLSMMMLFSVRAVPVLALNYEKQELDCAQKKDMRNKAFNEAVMEDIFSSYGHKYDEIIDQSMYINFIDLMKYSVIAGKRDVQLESIKGHMSGESTGEKRIYFFHGNPNEAYIFYKDLESQNIAIHLERTNSEWTIKDTKIKKGKKIPFIREKCEDDYFMKRMFNNLYQK